MVRRLLREVELRQDIRAAAIFSLMLYTGCRVSDVVNLEPHDLILGSATARSSSDSARGRSSALSRCRYLLGGQCRLPHADFLLLVQPRMVVGERRQVSKTHWRSRFTAGGSMLNDDNSGGKVPW
ncbi:hypothetical protein AYO44_08915 [Planctomycetaceae bacterium SCGC AG-212-F19]|nr:hypothetical protein AYO44_08915 [Planctomycetaceae bacterium SCGC AG-212-F19]